MDGPNRILCSTPNLDHAAFVMLTWLPVGKAVDALPVGGLSVKTPFSYPVGKPSFEEENADREPSKSQRPENLGCAHERAKSA